MACISVLMVAQQIAMVFNCLQLRLVKPTRTFYTYDVSGNWHFVFLDACHTADSSNWANRFNISSSYSNRAYLGWSGAVLTGNSYKFAVQFWPLVGTMSIRNAAVAAAAEVEGSGTTPIRFYGDTSYYGKAWS